MDDAFLPFLRCPIDPTRQAALTRDQQSLVCDGCQVRFPVKQGLPILIADEAELPAGVKSEEQVACIRAGRKRRRDRTD